MVRGRGKVSFQLPIEPAPAEPAWTYADDGNPVALSLLVLDSEDAWNISSHSRKTLAQEIVDLVAAMVTNGSFFTSIASYRFYKYALTNIIRHIESNPSYSYINRICDINIEFLNSIDSPQNTSHDYKKLSVLVVSLRAARRFFPNNVASDFSDHANGDRLGFVSNYPKPRSRPRDPYSPYLVQQIKDAAIAEMRSASARMEEGIKYIDALRTTIANGGSGKLSPTDRALYALSETGVVEADEYYRDLRSAGINRIAPPSISDAQASALALRVAHGVRERDVERENGLPIGAIYRLINGRPDFIELIEGFEDRWLEEFIAALTIRREFRDIVADTYKVEAAYSRHCAAVAGIGSVKTYWPSLDECRHQLERRRVVLTRWAESGVPREKLGTVNFRRRSISEWTDAELGIDPMMVTAVNRKILETCCAPEIQEIEAALATLQSEHPRLFCAGHVINLHKKIEYLENALISGNHNEILIDEYNHDGFCRWTDLRRGIRKTSKVRATKNDPQYGNIIQYAVTLVRALKISCRQSRQIEGRRASYVRLSSEESPGLSGSKLCPLRDELTSFFVYLGLICQIDLTSMKNITCDCLANENAGFVDIIYTKTRPKPATKVIRERDRSYTSPGGVIRSVLRLTQIARKALEKSGRPDANRLWLCFYPSGFRRCRFNSVKADHWKRFCERNVIWGDDGRRLTTLKPSRFRKTVKATKYKKHNGDILAIADDHSFAVARDHYADVPALVQTHNDTITRGLKRALEDVTCCIVLDESQNNAASELAALAGVPLETATRVVAGDEDSWLAGCLSFTHGPYGAPGEPCPRVFTKCIECSCSVFFKRKLPNILRYRNWLVDRRSIVAADTWAKNHESVYLRIQTQILPKFSEEEVQKAENIISMDPEAGALFVPGWLLEAM